MWSGGSHGQGQSGGRINRAGEISVPRRIWPWVGVVDHMTKDSLVRFLYGRGWVGVVDHKSSRSCVEIKA